MGNFFALSLSFSFLAISALSLPQLAALSLSALAISQSLLRRGGIGGFSGADGTVVLLAG